MVNECWEKRVAARTQPLSSTLTQTTNPQLTYFFHFSAVAST